MSVHNPQGDVRGSFVHHSRFRIVCCYLSLVLGFGFAAPATAAESDMTCVLSVHSFQPTNLVFSDGFETGDLQMWLDPVPSFSVKEALELEMAATLLEGIPGDDTLELELVTPNGHVFRSYRVPVAVESAHDAHESSASSAITVQQSFPLRGTQVDKNTLFGIWELRVRLLRLERSCSEPLRFRILQ